MGKHLIGKREIGESSNAGNRISGRLRQSKAIKKRNNARDSKESDVVFSDLDVMDCHICSEPYNLPIFQCTNGHAVCSDCHSQMDRCGLCKVELTRYRCYLFEEALKVLELPCKHQQYGCKEVIKCTERRAHQRSCVFQPCLCPQTGCNFMTSSMLIGRHFKTKHQLRVAPFHYNETFSTSIYFNDKVNVLQAQVEDKLFVITNKVDNSGNIINLYHIGLNKPNRKFYYEISVSSYGGGKTISSRSEVLNIHDGVYPNPLESTHLCVPFAFFPNGWLTMRVRIDVESEDDS